METTTPTKTRMPIHYIVKNYGYGAVSLLAKELGKSPTLMSITLAQKRISIK